jgi:predicted nucleic acid-binding protein
VKLPLEEAGHSALLDELAEWDGYVSSTLLAVEAIRACARYGPERAADAREWLVGLALLPLDDTVMNTATALAPAPLRSLDALHLATALTIRDDVGAFVSYDDRLATAAAAHGLPVVRPGLDARSSAR